GPFGVVARGRLDRVARIAQAHEVHALDDAAVLDVQTHDDPLGQHALSSLPRLRWRVLDLPRDASIGSQPRSWLQRTGPSPGPPPGPLGRWRPPRATCARPAPPRPRPGSPAWKRSTA